MTNLMNAITHDRNIMYLQPGTEMRRTELEFVYQNMFKDEDHINVFVDAAGLTLAMNLVDGLPENESLIGIRGQIPFAANTMRVPVN